MLYTQLSLKDVGSCAAAEIKVQSRKYVDRKSLSNRVFPEYLILFRIFSCNLLVFAQLPILN